jgi:nickel-dependent lactate racemase
MKTVNDVRERFGVELVDELTVRIHDSDDQDQIADLGRLSSGVPLHLNREMVESDLVILESTVEPHFFAGFTGGSKVILPGVAGTDTTLGNHRWQNIDDARSRYGILENLVRADADECLRYLKKVLCLNLVLDDSKRIVYATAGETIASFKAAAEAVSLHSRVQVRNRPDLVITTNGGYPLDRNLYQCVKGIVVPEQILHPGSKIIMVSECLDGVADYEFFKLVTSDCIGAVYGRLREAGVAVRGQWEAQALCRILSQYPVWFVTRPELADEVRSMHMNYAATVEQALDSARIDQLDRILVVPDGPSRILTL